jgi:N-acetylglucosamine-6-phosphate deacetylase
MRCRARHYRTGQLIDVLCTDDRIDAIEPAGRTRADCSAGWVAPALFDLQINGCEGRAFVAPTLTADDVHAIVQRARKHGLSGLCPTLITASFAALTHGFRVLQQACAADRSIARALPCFHLEGPYISGEDGPRGAHPREHVRPPDLDEFRRLQEAAGGRIRLVTISPEYDQALPFIETLANEGIVVAIGHTAATSTRIREAIRAGARLSTHLGNGSHALLPRHDNYLWEQLAADDLVASFIPDGHHLPATLLRCLLRVKTPARLIITCDASSLAGLPTGRYSMWGQELEIVPEGKIVVPGTTFLAGSAVFTDSCIRTLLRLGEVSLADALDMAGLRPRALLGLELAELTEGAPADLVLFDHEPGEEFTVRATVVAGKMA